jgi:hypothetical protein
MNEDACLSIQYNSQIVTCTTVANSTDPYNKGTGNLASGLTDLIERKTLKCNTIQQLPSARTSNCCNIAPQISPYAGGNSSGAFLLAKIRSQQECTAKSNRLLALQRVPPVCTQPQRFTQYQRPIPQVPCTQPPPGLIIKSNPAVPDAINGPCTNVIGISVTHK